MENKTFSLHKFNDIDFGNFSVSDYSKFKHGSLTIAHKFGQELAQGFIKATDLEKIDKQIVVYPSPYYFIPSACTFIKDSFLHELNRHLVRINKPTALSTKILRRLSYHSDYGKMKAEERANLIAQDKFYLDKEFAKEHHNIFLDDVKITGSHEIEIMKLINGHPIDYSCVYYAEYKGKNELIEDFLNTNTVKDINGIDEIIKSEPFFLNVRNIRVILSLDNDTFYKFINNQTDVFNNELFNLCIGNEYHRVFKYKPNLLTLSRYIQYNHLELVY